VDKRLYVTILYDFYGGLLTDKQKEIFEMYYLNDLSLSEIGASGGVSRQAVSDLLRRTTKLLTDYEERLGLAARHTRLLDCIDKLAAQCNGLREVMPAAAWHQIDETLTEIREL